MLIVILWVVVSGLIGWLASVVMRTNKDQGIQLDVVVGVGGALLAGFINSGWSINRVITLESALWSFAGAIVLLGIVNLLRKGRIR
jgi:uncharacterized membrane protein YeaQ/YmgE (transglycosylase-associated protein family)